MKKILLTKHSKSALYVCLALGTWGGGEQERKRLTSVSSSASVVGLDSELHASSATTPQLFIMKNADSQLRCLFSFSFPNDEKQCWSGEGERKAGAALLGQNFVPH